MIIVLIIYFEIFMIKMYWNMWLIFNCFFWIVFVWNDVFIVWRIDGFFLMNVLWNWYLNFFFFKIRKVNIVILYMVLIIKNVFVEFIDNGLKKIKIYVIIIINRNE